jgi:hypothetical protein
MNKSKGHWMLSNALTTTIALTVNMETSLLPLFGGPNISSAFENEILVLHINVWLEVIKVIKPFL